MWLCEPPCRSQRWVITCSLKCGGTVWCPTVARFYPGVRSYMWPGIPGKALHSLFSRAAPTPVSFFPLLQINICCSSLLIMNKEEMISQCNNCGKEAEPAVGRLQLPFAMGKHAHTKGSIISLMHCWIADIISWSCVCIFKEVNWQLNLH